MAISGFPKNKNQGTGLGFEKNTKKTRGLK